MAPGDNNDQAVRERAVNNIMKLVHTQLSLEAKQAKRPGKDTDTDIAARMAEVDETLRKLVAVAVKKGWIDSDSSVESLKAEVSAKKEQEQEDTDALMTAMKTNLEKQTESVSEFQRDRFRHDMEWEEQQWAKLLNSNQDTLVLMQQLYDRGVISQEMIQMATLPNRPPPRIQPTAAIPQNMMNTASSFDQQNSTMGSASGYGMLNNGTGSMMGTGSMGGAVQPMPGMMPHGMPGMMPHGMPGMMPHGVMPHGMMPPHGMMAPGVMPHGMMAPGMMPHGMMHNGIPGSGLSSVPGGGSIAVAEDDDDETEDELNMKLRTLKGLDENNKANKKKSKSELEEEALFKKNKGIGQFNNNFKVADDIRTLGAVPEDVEEDEKMVPIDKHMAKAMEERLLKDVEKEIFRERQDIIRSFMRGGGDSSMMGSAGAMSTMGGANSQMMQMQLQMQQQQMMQLQSMMMQMSMRPDTSMMYGSHMGGMPSQVHSQMGQPSSMTPSQMGTQHSSMMYGMGSQPSLQPGLSVPGMSSGYPMQNGGMPMNGSMQPQSGVPPNGYRM